MPLKCSTSSPAWISSPMKARAHTSSFRSLVGEYEMLQSVKSVLWFIKIGTSLSKTKQRNWKETKSKIKYFTVNFLKWHHIFIVLYKECIVWIPLGTRKTHLSSFLGWGHVLNYSLLKKIKFIKAAFSWWYCFRLLELCWLDFSETFYQCK